MLNHTDLVEILKKNKIIDDKQLKSLSAKAESAGQPLEAFVISQKIIDAKLLYQAAADFYSLPFIEIKDRPITAACLQIIPKSAAKTHGAIAFDQDESGLKIATLNPADLEFFDFLSKKTGLEIIPHLTSPEDFEAAFRQYQKPLDAELTNGMAAGAELGGASSDLPIIKIVDSFLSYAIAEKASDIHIEPQENEVTLRFRIDGILKKAITLPKATHEGILARLKILANLKLDEHRLPQDGRFKIKNKDSQMSFRLSIIPAFDGEKAVLRLLPDQTKALTLEELGFQSRALEIMKRNLAKTSGMILVTGPTGSGKTTTLYTAISLLNKPEVNISTIEDPIEYRMPGVNQCQVQPKIGFNFAAGLRAFLRQDPNIIMVGEIRDLETADIAVNAAMTGHLVLSTLHTNDAITAIPRLLDMKIPSFLIASTVSVIVAQRLARKICPNCIESYKLSDKVLGELDNVFDLKRLEKNLTDQGLLGVRQSLSSVLFFRGRGCDQCDQSGYRGRVGIYEVLENNAIISEMIISGASRDKLAEAAAAQGMLTMYQDAFIKAKSGQTTIEEILRVARE